MMKKLRQILIGSMAAYVLTALVVAQAQDLGGNDHYKEKGPFEQHSQEIYNQLNLTDEQKTKLEANKQQHKAQIDQLRQSMRSEKEALQQELMKSQLDMSKINALEGEIKTLMPQMEDARLSSILAVRTILTPEQFATFINLMHQHRQEHKE